jgi:gas vesicle protein
LNITNCTGKSSLKLSSSPDFKEETKISDELPIELWTQISIFQNQGGYENLMDLFKTAKGNAREWVKLLEGWEEKVKTEKNKLKKEFKQLIKDYRDTLLHRLEVDKEIKQKLADSKEKLEGLWYPKDEFDCRLTEAAKEGKFDEYISSLESDLQLLKELSDEINTSLNSYSKISQLK